MQNSGFWQPSAEAVTGRADVYGCNLNEANTKYVCILDVRFQDSQKVLNVFRGSMQ